MKRRWHVFDVADWVLLGGFFLFILLYLALLLFTTGCGQRISLDFVPVLSALIPRPLLPQTRSRALPASTLLHHGQK
jgi:hypothetical protein